ncbi:MAG: tetratricopeptide repeat protein [Bdellovibrionales bacterium]|nr:tetratricopeptide repeat protein [Bdellovibrionales bacterium]
MKMGLIFTLLMTIAVQTQALPKHGDPKAVASFRSATVGLTSKITFKKMQRVQTLLSNNQMSKAEGILEKLIDATEGRASEQAQILNTLGSVYASQEKYKLAEKVFERAIKLKALPYEMSLSTLYNLAQLSMGQGHIHKAHTYLNEWFAASESPKPAGYVLHAYIMMELKKPKEAAESVEFALSKTREAPQSWLQLGAALAFENGQYKRAVEHLKALLSKHPKEEKYWKQIIAAYMNLDDLTSALSSMELAYKQGFYREDKEILNLSSLLAQQGLPYWGGVLLEVSMKKNRVAPLEKNYRVLAQMWMMAEEYDRAIDPLKAALKQAKDGETSLRLGQLYMEKENWQEAQKYLQQALNKGGLNSPESVHLALGIVFVSLMQNSEAEKHFKISLKNEKTKNSAQQWLNHISKS